MGRNNHFQFKQFRIEQHRSAMKVGMDGVLIGAWANVSMADSILDVGAGTGLITLMMAQRSPLARVQAIEIEREAYEECLFNVKQSAWADRIKVTWSSFQDFIISSDEKYDLIISNPPFFTNGLKAPNSSRSQARHDDSLPVGELISGIARLLLPQGKAALILPVENLSELKKCLNENGLFLSRLCQVKPNPHKPVFRIMVEISPMECICQEEELLIEYEKHFDYTPEYRTLTRDFYLKFE
ncbi:MAG: tRNA1(Val) (adenine(37)-N6)-methyltransferase [Candidatus Saccharibacteria bacterium]